MPELFRMTRVIEAEDKKKGIAPEQLADWLLPFKGQDAELRVQVGWKGQVVKATLNWK